jgi:hypothetical protein
MEKEGNQPKENITKIIHNLKTWGVIFTLFMAVFTACILTIFKPYTIITDYGLGPTETAVGAASDLGLKIMAKNWVKNPDYFINLGIIAGISIIGGGYSVFMLTKESQEKSVE